MSQGSDEVGATARCSTCNLSMKTSRFLEDLKREETENCEDIFKKSFFEKLDRKGNVITVDGGKDGLLLYRELDCYIQDFMLNLIINSAQITQRAGDFLLKQLHEKNVVQRGMQQWEVEQSTLLKWKLNTSIIDDFHLLFENKN